MAAGSHTHRMKPAASRSTCRRFRIPEPNIRFPLGGAAFVPSCLCVFVFFHNYFKLTASPFVDLADHRPHDSCAPGEIDMNVLMLFPKFPAETFWNSVRSLRRFTRYRVDMPPLGLLTLASYMPADFQLRLIDRNLAEETAADWDGRMSCSSA